MTVGSTICSMTCLTSFSLARMGGEIRKPKYVMKICLGGCGRKYSVIGRFDQQPIQSGQILVRQRVDSAVQQLTRFAPQQHALPRLLVVERAILERIVQGLISFGRSA